MSNFPESRPVGPLDPTAGAQPAKPYYETDEFDGASEASASGLDIRAIRAIIYRNRLIIGGVVLLALLGGLIVTLLTTPIYRATASVQIEQQTSNILATEDVQPLAAIQDAGRFLETQQEIIRSRALARRVADSLSLYNNDTFLTSMRLKPVDGTGTAARDTRRELVISVLKANLTVEMPRTSRVASISFQSPDRELAARIVNSYARNYITANLARRVDASAYARSFLEGQIAETKRKLEESERGLIGYARNASLIDASGAAGATGEGTGPQSLTTANLVEINSVYVQARAKRVQAEQRWHQVENTPVMSLPEVLNNSAVQSLVQSRADKRAAFEQLKARYRPDHPLMVQATAEIRELDTQIAQQAANIRRSIRDEFVVAQQQEQSLSNNVQALRSDTLNEQDRRIQYNILKREADTNRALYDGLLQRYKEITAAAGIATNNVSIIDDALVPGRPIKPQPLMNLLIAAALGCIAAAGIVFIREMFDDVIRTPDEVQRKLGLSFLGGIPLTKQGSTMAEALEDSRSSISEAYYSLRTSLEFATPRGAPSVILFTSSQPAEGKSTSALATAQGFARIGRRVVLIDGDLRKPSLHNLLGLGTQNGFVNLLTGQMTLEQVTQPTAMPNLSFIACGPLPPNPAELLASAALPRVLAMAREHFDMVIIDGPPVMGLADSQLLAREARGTVFVIEASRAHRGQAKAAIRRLLASRAHILGVLLTKFDSRRGGYGYGSAYGYDYYDYGQKTD